MQRLAEDVDLSKPSPGRRRPTAPRTRARTARSRDRRRLRVLLIEDSADTLALYASYLSRVGMDVATAADGVTGIATARSLQPDLIVMDLGLPVLDGIEATRRLKADPATAAIPVMALTAYVFTGRKSARDAGCDAFVPKPCLPEQLAQLIRALVKGERQRPPRARRR
jgi:CheY-like chemotaxis protein